MELRRGRAGGAVAFAILLCALATASSEGRRLTAEGLFGNGGGLAKQVWSDCRNEMMDRKEVPKNFDLYIPPDGTGDMKLTSLTRTNINKAIRVLPPQTKQELLDCLIKKSPIFPVSGKDSFNSWLKKGAELLYGWSNAPGSNLWRLAPGLATGAAPAGAPEVTNYGPAPSYSALASSPSPSPSPNPQPPIETPEEPPIPPDIINPPPPLSAHEHSPPSSHVGPPNTSKNVDDSSKRTIIVVAATAAVAVVIAALILLCCLRGRSNKIGPRDGQKDEGHLLTLNLSDFSAGSSQNTVSLGNSGNKEFSAIGGNNIALESDNHGSVADASSSHGIGPFPPPKPSPTPPPPGPPPLPPGPRPPPPPKAGRPPPLPPKSGLGTQPSPLGHHRRESSASNEGNNPDGESDGPKTKLKPFFWDKVLANPDHSMVWHEIKAGSFQFNEEKIESLFGYNNVNNNNDRKKESSSLDPSIPHIQIIDTKKARNLSILLRALNVTTEEVCDALQEGNELPTELLETLLKMAPTADEELKLRLFTGDITQLGPAERFLKALVEIPFASKRLESLLFMSSLQEEISSIKESFATLEVACNKLRHSRLFLKLLEAVLKTGNRMNDGTFRGRAEAFKLDTLLKLADVKGTDGKITLLHFVVHEIIRSEGIRAVRTARASQSLSSVKSDDFIEDSSHEAEEHYRKLGLQVVSGLSTELEDVKKAAMIDADGLSATVCTLGRSLTKTRDFLTTEMNSLDEDSDFHRTLASFVERAEADILWLLEEEKRIMALVKGTTDYFHGHAGKDEGLRLFAIIRDFLIMLDKSCKEVSETTMKIPRSSKKETPSASPSSENCQPPSDIHQRLFPAIMERRVDNSSSDDESPSP